MKPWITIILAAWTVASFGQGHHKFYVTGYASTQPGGDCTHPALIAYGNNRVDALINVGISPYFGGVTVWTEAEYTKMRGDIGKSFDDGCKQLAKTKTTKPEAQP